MEPQPDQSPLVVIVGETASGKSALAMQLAQQFQGEIVAADSRTVYTDLDIGTAKPSADDQARVQHHLIDVVSPDESFTVAQFKHRAQQAIQEICRRGHLPLLVGGSGLYVDAVIYNFSFREGAVDHAQRQQLQSLSIEELQQLILQRRIALPQNDRNPRHLIRTLETNGAVGSSRPLRKSTLILGVRADREILREKIALRVEAMVEQGLVEEVRRAAEAYGWDAPALQAPGYKSFRKYIEGAATLEEAKELFIRADMQLAKRQRTWFKRNKSIHWISKKEEAVDLVTTFLNK